LLSFFQPEDYVSLRNLLIEADELAEQEDLLDFLQDIDVLLLVLDLDRAVFLYGQQERQHGFFLHFEVDAGAPDAGLVLRLLNAHFSERRLVLALLLAARHRRIVGGVAFLLQAEAILGFILLRAQNYFGLLAIIRVLKLVRVEIVVLLDLAAQLVDHELFILQNGLQLFRLAVEVAFFLLNQKNLLLQRANFPNLHLLNLLQLTDQELVFVEINNHFLVFGTDFTHFIRLSANHLHLLVQLALQLFHRVRQLLNLLLAFRELALQPGP